MKVRKISLAPILVEVDLSGRTEEQPAIPLIRAILRSGPPETGRMGMSGGGLGDELLMKRAEVLVELRDAEAKSLPDFILPEPYWLTLREALSSYRFGTADIGLAEFCKRIREAPIVESDIVQKPTPAAPLETGA